MMKKILLIGLSSCFLAACGGSGAGTTTTPDGTKINLDFSPKGLIEVETTDGKLRGWNQDSSFYGAWLNNSGQFRELHYQGSLTPERNIPNSGKATYYGNAVRYDSINENILDNAKSRLEVDFGRKTVSGEIEMPGFRRNITLKETKHDPATTPACTRPCRNLRPLSQTGASAAE